MLFVHFFFNPLFFKKCDTLLYRKTKEFEPFLLMGFIENKNKKQKTKWIVKDHVRYYYRCF